jgi:hypothetical protein
MKLKYTFVINEVAGQTVAVPIDCADGEQNIIKTNATGAYILNLLKTETTIDKILEDIKQNYEIPSEEELKNWVIGFIEKLKTADVLADD